MVGISEYYKSNHLFSVPVEVLEHISCYIEAPQNWFGVAKHVHSIGQSPSFRLLWLKSRYGKKRGLLLCCAKHTGLVRSDDVGLATLRLLINAYPTPMPRYIIQAACRSLSKHNLKRQVAQILLHGVSLYDDLALMGNDFVEFQCLFEAPTWEEPGVPMGLDDGYYKKPTGTVNIHHFNVPYHISSQSERLLQIKQLVEHHNFDLSGNVVPTRCALCITIADNNWSIFLYLMKHGIATYDHLEESKSLPSIPTICHCLTQAKNSQQLSDMLGPKHSQLLSIREINGHKCMVPITLDAVIAATAFRREAMLKILLERTSDRWRTAYGQCVLCACLQIAIDSDWSAGRNVLLKHFQGAHGLRKSQLRLHGDFSRAVEQSDVPSILTILRNGILFDLDDVGGLTEDGQCRTGVLGEVFLGNNHCMLVTLLAHYQFSKEVLESLVLLCIHQNKLQNAQMILSSGQHCCPPVLAFKLCIARGYPDTLEKLIQVRQLYLTDDGERQVVRDLIRFGQKWRLLDGSTALEYSKVMALLLNWESGVSARLKQICLIDR